MQCWHFANTTLRDGSPLPRRGESLNGKTPVLCQSGYHGSVRALDALTYAPGAMVARVELRGTIVTGSDKACASERLNLTDYVDATRTLLECGYVSTWGPNWQWYGSLRDEDNGKVVKMCGELCRAAFVSNGRTLPIPVEVVAGIRATQRYAALESVPTPTERET